MRTKTVLVTGATRNTGLAIVERFVQEGWKVILTSRDVQSAQEAAQRVNASYEDAPVAGIALQMETTEAIAEAFRQVDQLCDHLDAFVANAADLGVGYSILNSTPEDYERVMNVNLRGSFFCCQHAARRMKNGGSIVVLSSVQSKGSIWGRTLYSVSKAGLNALVRCMAVELGHLGIRANALIAGAIWSNRWEEQNAELTAARRAQYPAGRESTPGEIAASVYFLCSDETRTITGAELTVDSGISACLLPYQNQKKEDWAE